jgi:hypothetical protein
MYDSTNYKRLGNSIKKFQTEIALLSCKSVALTSFIKTRKKSTTTTTTGLTDSKYMEQRITTESNKEA